MAPEAAAPSKVGDPTELPAYRARGTLYALVLGTVVLGVLSIFSLTVPGALVVGIFAAFLALILLLMIFRGSYAIPPFQVGLVTMLGSPKGKIGPGFNWVNPLAVVVRVDLRTQVSELPKTEYLTKDHVRVALGGSLYWKVVDPAVAIFRVQSHEGAIKIFAQTALKELVRKSSLESVAYSRETLNDQLKGTMAEATTKWGVRVEGVDLKDIEVLGKMEIPGIERIGGVPLASSEPASP